MTSPHEFFANRINASTQALLGQQSVTHTIMEWCQRYQAQCDDILSGRGLSLPSIGIVGAKGQGKTWVAKQFVLDQRIADSLPSGVLSSEATTQLHWVGPSPPDGLDASKEQFHLCGADRMLDLKRPYLVLDTPGYTDDDRDAAAISRDALNLSPVKLIVARRDQLRSAIHSQLAHFTEGALCVPIVTCVPPRELTFPARTDSDSESSKLRISDSLKSDIESFLSALRASAPSSRLLDPVYVPDFESTGDESAAGKSMSQDLQSRLSNNALESLSATKPHRLTAASDRLKHDVVKLLDQQIPQLAAAVRKLHTAADMLPSQTIETVLGSKDVLESAVRERIRSHTIASTSLLCFPYRTILNILAFTNGAWDRLLLAMSGSVPSIFGTFAAWARNVQQSRKIQWEFHEGIRDRLQGQIADRLEPIQNQFYRAVDRLRGRIDESRSTDQTLKMRLSGIEELQAQAREVFEYTVQRQHTSRWSPQLLGLLGTLMFWALMAGPIISIYRQYLWASAETLSGKSVTVDAFPHPGGGLLSTSLLISLLPVLIFAMIVLSWLQRPSKVRRIADIVYSAEMKMVDELKRSGVIALHFDDPLLEHAEFLVNLDRS